MLRANILLVLVVASSGAPSPYYTSSLIETPTSRFESHLLLSAPSHDSYKFEPHHVIPQSGVKYANQQPFASRISSMLNVDTPKLPASNPQVEQRIQPSPQSTQPLKMQPESETVEDVQQLAMTTSEVSTVKALVTKLEEELPKSDVPKLSRTMQQIKQESYEIFRPMPLSVSVQAKQAELEDEKSEEAELVSETTPLVMTEMNIELKKSSAAKPKLDQTLKEEMKVQENTKKAQPIASRVQGKSFDSHTQVILPEPQAYVAQPQVYSAQRQYAIPQAYYPQAHHSTPYLVPHLPLSPQLQNFYRIHPQAFNYYPQAYESHHFNPQTSPLSQQFVSHHHPQLAHQVQRPVGLFELRQDEVPWWQDLYNQFVGQGQEGSQEGSQESGEKPNEESEGNEETAAQNVKNSPEESPEQIKKLIDLELVQTTLAPRHDSEENNSAEETTEDRKQVDLVSTSSTELFSTTLRPKADNDDSVVIDRDYGVVLNAEKLTESVEKLDSPAENENICEHARQVKAPLHQLYSFNDQYYVLSGSPKFYGNIDPRSLMLSLQKLQPVVRNDDNDDEVMERKTESISTQSVELSNKKLGKIIVQEQDEMKKKYNDEELQESALSESPSERQSAAFMGEEARETRDEEKEEQSSSAQGRELHDDSSVAQAKPSAIAIAGAGGVASSKPQANAVSGPNGLSVASPSATSVAGDFVFDSEDRKKSKTRQP